MASSDHAPLFPLSDLLVSLTRCCFTAVLALALVAVGLWRCGGLAGTNVQVCVCVCVCGSCRQQTDSFFSSSGFA